MRSTAAAVGHARRLWNAGSRGRGAARSPGPACAPTRGIPGARLSFCEPQRLFYSASLLNGTLQVKVYFIKSHSGNPCCWGQAGQVGKEKLSEY